MKTINKKALPVRILSGAFLLFACFCMYDFYKCLSGFIANGFREPLVMLPMILAFFLPVLCFLVFFYDFFVNAIHPIVKTAYSVFVSLYAIADLVLIFNNFELYASNSALGVYDALPSILLRFPYDMITVLFIILAVQVFNLAAGDRRETKTGAFINGLKQRGSVSVGIVEYIALCVLAIIVFVFTGAGIYATFSAFSNAFYNYRYLFLLLWVAVIPMANLAILTLKPEKSAIRKGTKLTLLGLGIGANLIFGLLFMILELTYPDFLVHIGKPVFLIAFSISLPIEPAIILGIMALGTLIMAIRLIIALTRKAEDV